MRSRQVTLSLAALGYCVSLLSACANDSIKQQNQGAPATSESAATGAEASVLADASALRDAMAADAPRVEVGDSAPLTADARVYNSSLPEGGSGGTGGSDAGSPPVVSDCDITGKWIATQRTLNEALGGVVLQSGHAWTYWEFEQHDTQAVVKKLLQCGEEIKDRSTSGLGAQVSSTQALWDGLTRNNKVLDEKASYAPVPGSKQCQLHIDKIPVVRGATFPYFSAFDANGFVHPIEDAVQQAQGSTPGWEDWDNDGHPGVTYHVSGIATGDLYMVQRDLVEYNGTTDKHSDKFKLAVQRLHEQRVIDQNPATLPSADVTPSSDPAEHFIWFARVDGISQWDLPANADDLKICAKMRALKDQLIPEGNL
jgi:hypothetical protein